MKLQATILTKYSFSQRLFLWCTASLTRREKNRTHLSCKRCPGFQMLNICALVTKRLCRLVAVSDCCCQEREVSPGNLCMPSHEESVNFFFCKGHSRLTLYTRSGAWCVRVINWSAFKSLGKKCKTQQSHYRFTAQILTRKRTIHRVRRCVMGQAQS